MFRSILLRQVKEAVAILPTTLETRPDTTLIPTLLTQEKEIKDPHKKRNELWKHTNKMKVMLEGMGRNALAEGLKEFLEAVQEYLNEEVKKDKATKQIIATAKNKIAEVEIRTDKLETQIQRLSYLLEPDLDEELNL